MDYANFTATELAQAADEVITKMQYKQPLTEEEKEFLSMYMAAKKVADDMFTQCGFNTHNG